MSPARLRRVVSWAWPLEYERARLALVLGVPEAELFQLDANTARLVNGTVLDPSMSAQVASHFDQSVSG